MSQEQVVQTVIRILAEYFEIPERVAHTHLESSLLLFPFNMDAISLTYLLLLLEAEFNTKLSPEYVDHYQFSTIKGIAQLFA